MAGVGDEIETENAAWSFGGAAEHFGEHVTRSVPLAGGRGAHDS
jgi:hypothetical protein